MKMSQDGLAGIAESTARISAMPKEDQSDARVRERAILFQDLIVHRESVFRICLGFSRNYAEAEDLAQDVYVRAFHGMKDLRYPGQAKEWLFRIAKNACLDRNKKDRGRAFLLRRWAYETKKEEYAPSENPDDVRLARLKSVIRGLPKKLRSVFVLREYGHLTYDEIAATLDLAKGTVMSRLSRARTKVAEVIEENSP
jgi:RNA polymerase sigma-70 factor (ECF subfamily)